MKKNFMKKSMMLGMVLLMTTSFSGCSKADEDTKKEDNAIELTMENYEDYLNVTSSVSATGKGYKITGLADPYYKEIASTINVEGVSSNYNYEDVKVEAEITVKYTPQKNVPYGRAGDDQLYTENLIADCNVAGEGSETISTQVQGGYTNNYYIQYACEVISISGSVVPAK